MNTNGDYAAGVGGPFYLTAGPSNFTGCTNTSLGFYLQQNSNLASTNWVNVTNGVAIAGTNYQVAVPVTNGVSFFRLMHP